MRTAVDSVGQVCHTRPGQVTHTASSAVIRCRSCGLSAEALFSQMNANLLELFWPLPLCRTFEVASSYPSTSTRPIAATGDHTDRAQPERSHGHRDTKTLSGESREPASRGTSQRVRGDCQPVGPSPRARSAQETPPVCQLFARQSAGGVGNKGGL